MRGNLWAVALAAIGAVVLVQGASTAKPTGSVSNSTEATASVLSQVAPFVSQLLAVAAIGALVIIAIRAV